VFSVLSVCLVCVFVWCVFSVCGVFLVCV